MPQGHSAPGAPGAAPQSTQPLDDALRSGKSRGEIESLKSRTRAAQELHKVAEYLYTIKALHTDKCLQQLHLSVQVWLKRPTGFDSLPRVSTNCSLDSGDTNRSNARGPRARVLTTAPLALIKEVRLLVPNQFNIISDKTHLNCQCPPYQSPEKSLGAEEAGAQLAQDTAGLVIHSCPIKALSTPGTVSS